MRNLLGEIKISLQDLNRGTTKPLIHNIEIVSTDNFDDGFRYRAILDTGADISFIDYELFTNLDLNRYKIDDKFDFCSLELVFHGFFEKSIVLEAQPFKFPNNNLLDHHPNIILGRDFLKNCEMFYNGLQNEVSLKYFDTKVL